MRLGLCALLFLSACGRTTPYEPRPGAAPQCTFGDVRGFVCSTDDKTVLNGAAVTLDAVDCGGRTVHLETQSAADGTFTLNHVPAGAVSVTATLGDFSRTMTLLVVADQVNALPAGGALCIAQRALKIAVVTGNGDKIQRLLTDLHLTFTTFDGTNGHWESQAAPFLADLSRLRVFDLVFIDCDAASAGGYTIDLGPRTMAIEQNLRSYVEGGGSLYGSDWAALLVSFAAPGALPLVTQAPLSFPFDAHELAGFAPQTVSASVADEGLRTFLGKPSIAVNFPRQGSAVTLHWALLDQVPAATVLAQADGVATCTDAVCATAGPSRDHVPLAVRVKRTPPGDRGGWVLYTSFHNIGQAGDDVARMLQYLVLNL